MPWEKGQSGNPKGAGDGHGSRVALAQTVAKRFYADFQKHGIAAIEQCRKKDPAKYLTIVTGLLPKEATLNVQHSFSDLLLEAAKRMQESQQVAHSPAQGAISHQPGQGIGHTITVEYSDAEALDSDSSESAPIYNDATGDGERPE